MIGNRWLIASLSVLIIFGGLLGGCSSGTSPNAQLLGITVSPESAKIAEDETKQFTATGHFNDGSTRDISPEVVWHSTNESVARIDINGLATGVTEGGTTLITATAGNLTSDPPAVLEVVSESNRLTKITIEPPVAQIQLGASRSFVAQGTYLDNSTKEITEDVIWESSNPTLVSISNNPGSKGVAIGLASGEVEINARLDDLISDPVTVTVTEVALISIAVSPLDPTLPLGAVQEFKATGTYSDDSTADLTKVVTWMSSNKVVADFSAEAGQEGFCTALAEGSTSITAISGSVISGPVSLTVTSATLQEITIEPVAPSVPVGTEVQFSAMGRYSDNQLLDITSMVTWNSSDLSKVVFDDQTDGLAEALEFGSAEIWASLGVIESNRITMTVNSADLVSIEISPVNPTLPIGQQLAFTAYGHYSDQNVVDITNSVDWDSSDKSVAIISNVGANKGTATGLSEGPTEISADLNGTTGLQTLQVKNIEIVS
ncbi:MAG: Ig-like domain-containing protein, partial [Deltaproteobacteria bacterium]|nr:Ig-like domain-containing protein [Deltaproteobacteria bacterium]